MLTPKLQLMNCGGRFLNLFSGVMGWDSAEQGGDRGGLEDETINSNVYYIRRINFR